MRDPTGRSLPSHAHHIARLMRMVTGESFSVALARPHEQRLSPHGAYGWDLVTDW
jgi:aromatic ring-cleaving dioxygenase